MPRPKSFDENLTVQVMMDVFWDKGYEATSMKDLEHASKLTTGSIYNEFGSKQALFIRVLTHYLEVVIKGRIKAYLQESVDPMAGIKQFLCTCYRNIPEQYQGKSCLLVNSAAELGQNNKEIGPVIKNGLKTLDKALVGAFKRAKDAGQLKPEVDSQLAGLHISLIMPGLLLAAKNRANHEHLDAVIEHTLAQYSL